ncbi:MAG: hypothetical protein SH817_09945 [Leptospira sp.]|nr:hypothetical protein [Leptospira sp.]
MTKIIKIAERLLKTYPIECTNYIPKHYLETDITGIVTYKRPEIIQLITAHLESAGIQNDNELYELAQYIETDMYNTYYSN